MKQFKDANTWLRVERAARQPGSMRGRQLNRRRRVAGCKRPPVRLVAGRPRHSVVSVESRNRRRRRWAECAAHLLPRVAGELVRVRVVAKCLLSTASDIRRSLRFAKIMRAVNRDLMALLVALLYERAWRDPVLSRRFLDHFTAACSAGHLPLEAAWLSIRKTRVLAPASRADHRFWSGPSAFAAAAGPWQWEKVVIESLARDIARHHDRINAQVYVAKLSALPYVSDYFAFSYLRTLEVLQCVTLHNVEPAAAAMSHTVASLTSICSLQGWSKYLCSLRLPGMRHCRIGDVTLIICETAKALQCLGFDVPKGAQVDRASFLEAFGGGCGRTLLNLLQVCEPLPCLELRAERGVRSTEAALIDNYFPRTRAAWDRELHVCRGSESLAPELRKMLGKQGYLFASPQPTA